MALVSEANEQDPWKSIHQLLGGKTPFIRLPDSMQGDWVQSMINDIVKRTVDSVAGAAGYVPAEEEGGTAARKARRRTPEGGSAEGRGGESERRGTPKARTGNKPVRTLPFAGGNPAVSSTDKTVVVRYRLPEGADAEKIRVFADAYSLRLQGLPGGRNPTIPIPGPVRAQGTTARLSGDVLTVRLPRSPRSREQEIFIRYE